MHGICFAGWCQYDHPGHVGYHVAFRYELLGPEQDNVQHLLVHVCFAVGHCYFVPELRRGRAVVWQHGIMPGRIHRRDDTLGAPFFMDYHTRAVDAILQYRLQFCGHDVRCGLDPIRHA